MTSIHETFLNNSIEEKDPANSIWYVLREATPDQFSEEGKKTMAFIGAQITRSMEEILQQDPDFFDATKTSPELGILRPKKVAKRVQTFIDALNE